MYRRRRQLVLLASSGYSRGFVAPSRQFDRKISDLARRTFHPVQKPLKQPSATSRLFLSSGSAPIDDSDDVKISIDMLQQIERKNQAIEKETRGWLDRVVVGMSMCPFAEKPMKEKRLKVTVLRGDDIDVILPLLFGELRYRVEMPGTTLVVCPELYPDSFEEYLGVLNMVENGLVADDEELDGFVQVAPFHPLFCFEGSGQNDVDNWTNRSPFPTFHILREVEVSKAADRLDGDAGKVWRRNVDLLTALEREFGEDLDQLMTGKLEDESSRKKLKTVLRENRVKLDKTE